MLFMPLEFILKCITLITANGSTVHVQAECAFYHHLRCLIQPELIFATTRGVAKEVTRTGAAHVLPKCPVVPVTDTDLTCCDYCCGSSFTAAYPKLTLPVRVGIQLVLALWLASMLTM